MPAVKKILVVDDEAVNRKLVTTILKKKKGLEPIEASNGVEALDILKKEPVDIVLLDIVMPVMNGLETLQEIRKIPQFVGLPVIILTTDDTKKSEAEVLGANDFITKPVSPGQLLDKIGEYI
jgi:CheY-like chemotaxis protein